MAETVRRAAGRSGLVVILDDIHWADEPSLLALRHLSDQVAQTGLLIFATFRHVEPAGASATSCPTCSVLRPSNDSISAGSGARHWVEVAPYGEGAVARRWVIRAADEAVRRLAYEEGGRLYRAALSFEPTSLADDERGRVLIALGRAASLAGDLQGCAEAAVAATDAGRVARNLNVVAEAALVLEATADPAVNAVARRLCEQALTALGDRDHEALRARLLAQRSHLAFYEGDGPRSTR